MAEALWLNLAATTATALATRRYHSISPLAIQSKSRWQSKQPHQSAGDHHSQCQLITNSCRAIESHGLSSIGFGTICTTRRTREPCFSKPDHTRSHSEPPRWGAPRHDRAKRRWRASCVVNWWSRRQAYIWDQSIWRRTYRASIIETWRPEIAEQTSREKTSKTWKTPQWVPCTRTTSSATKSRKYWACLDRSLTIDWGRWPSDPSSRRKIQNWVARLQCPWCF